MKKSALLIFIIIISMSFISSACSVVSRNSCSENIIMGLSSNTNAHGQTYDYSSYDYVLCCDSGSYRTCKNNNVILKLSSDTNAHAQEPSIDTFPIDVCYAGFICTSRETCESGETEILSLTASTDAHIGSIGDYNTKICCVQRAVYWADATSEKSVSNISLMVGQNIKLVLKNSGLAQGTSIDFNIKENDLLFDDSIRTIQGTVDASGDCEVIWEITQADLDETPDDYEEFYFEVSVSGNTLKTEYLNLTIISSEFCKTNYGCSSYLSQTDCEADLCSVADGNVESNNLGLTCGEGGVSCQCEWVSDSCEASYSTFLDGVNIGKCSYTEGGDDNCDDGLLVYSWTANWNWGHDGWVDFNDGPSTNVGDYYSSDGVYYYDPSNQFEGCSEGDTVIECPANVALPFFEFWQIIIVLGIISGIYFFRNKNLKKKSKKKK